MTKRLASSAIVGEAYTMRLCRDGDVFIDTRTRERALPRPVVDPTGGVRREPP